jgi:hypothetical protein
MACFCFSNSRSTDRGLYEPLHLVFEQREVFRTSGNLDMRWTCGGCAVDVRWICTRTCADIAMSVLVDIARISHGYSTTRRHAAREITRRTLSCYSYVCHYPFPNCSPRNLCPPSLACAQPSVMHCASTRATPPSPRAGARMLHRRTDKCSRPPRWPRPAQAPPFEHQSSGSPRSSCHARNSCKLEFFAAMVFMSAGRPASYR